MEESLSIQIDIYPTGGIRPSLGVVFCGTVQAPTTSPSPIWTLTILLTLLPLHMQEKQTSEDVH